VRRRTLVLVSLLLVGLSLTTGVDSASSVSADRTVSAAVAPDGEAYLGIQFGAVDNDTRELRVYNNVSRDDLTVTVDGHEQSVGPGETAEFEVDCDSTVGVTAVGPDVRIDATRDVDCVTATTRTPTPTPTRTATDD
jgi:hypothetical protein